MKANETIDCKESTDYTDYTDEKQNQLRTRETAYLEIIC